MAELILEHLFFRIEIIANEIEKFIRFANFFPLGHRAWRRYNYQPIHRLLKYVWFSRTCPPIEYDDSTIQEFSDSDDDTQGPPERRRSELYQLNSSPTVSERNFHEAPSAEPEVFEDALES